VQFRRPEDDTEFENRQRAAAAETVVFLVVFFSLSTQASQKFRFLCHILIFSVIAMSSMTRKREYVAMIF